MQNIEKDITESIKSGQYFKDAKNWYALKYTYPLTQRSFLLVITVASIVMVFIAIKIFLTFLPLTQVVPIVVSIDSQVEQYAVLKSIGKLKKDPNESLIKYLIVRYIEARENYDYESVVRGNKFKYLKDFSSRNVFNKYKKYISLENPRSPILRYKKYAKRIVEPLNVQILREVDENNVPKKIESGRQKITVKFRASEVSSKGVQSSIWLAKIEADFEVVEYSKEIKKFSPLNFRVKYYKVSKLGDEKNEKKIN